MGSAIKTSAFSTQLSALSEIISDPKLIADR